MQFTYNGYKKLLKMLADNGFKIVGYDEYKTVDSCVILRHDIDYSLEKALEISKIEYEFGAGLKERKSTFFIMLSNEFYNPFAIKEKNILQEIQSHGNEIGLHFSEHSYPDIGKENLMDKILMEADILGKAVGAKITKVSMHNPSKEMLDTNLEVLGMINVYSEEYFNGFKYLSDSGMYWREPADEYITKRKFKRLHILTHPIWWNENEKNLHEAYDAFINQANFERYENVKAEFYGVSKEAFDVFKKEFTENDLR